MTAKNLIGAVATASLMALVLGAGAAQAQAAAPAKAARAPATSKAPYKAPKTHFGHPDLSGNWTNNLMTRLERDPKLGEQKVLTEAQAKAIEATSAKMVAEQDKPTAADAPAGVSCKLDCPYNNSAWSEAPKLALVNGEIRSSLITFPANGRLPPMTPQAQARKAEIIARNKDITPLGGEHLTPVGGMPSDNPETRTLAERCISIFGDHAGPVMMGGGYNSNYKFMQSKDELAILVEMPHDQRYVRIGGKHPPSSVRLWNGDSVGHWEGDTLVSETTNFRPDQTDFQYSSMIGLKVVEKFTRVGPDRLLYQFEVTDPDTWTQPWGGEYEMTRSPGEIYEYACAEGNYGLRGILEGSREEERIAAEASAKPPAAQPAPTRR